MNIKIRKEIKKDYFEVERITRDAFYNEKDFKEKGFGCSEHFMVNQLREKDGIMDLDFVAEKNNEIVGHIIYSQAIIKTIDNKTINVITFGPLTIKKEYQNKGIGSQLMLYSINEAKKLGYGAILFFGHPNYYPRFGFTQAKNYNITTKNNENFPAFMAMELIPDYLKGIKGKFIESEIFDEMAYQNEIIEYDNKFK
ncbi:MAG: N-acetyltransferase [Candidatus Izimaplasma sp.]|nr:N-acetyltransferase [Candidatus Izimaplasma bacterium]